MRVDKIDTVVIEPRITTNNVIKQLNKIARNFVFAWRGDWDTDTDYEIGDVVLNDGSLWLSLTKNKSVEPVEGDDWTMLAGSDTSSRAFAMFIS